MNSETVAYIRGVGNTKYVKKAERSVEALAVEAIDAAASDAGIPVSEIDGIIVYHGHIGTDEVIAQLALPDVKLRAIVDIGGASAVAALQMASLYVLGGVARNVILVRGIKGNSGPRKAQRKSFLPSQQFRTQLEYVAGCNTPSQRYALLCRRYMHEHGLTREHLAEIALAARWHANLNPDAQMYERTLELEEYLSGRVIADPYRLYDCCLESDGACAVIVSAQPGGDDQRPAVAILATEEGHADPPDDISNRDPFLHVGLEKAAARLWNAVSLGPDDMDAAMVYDCFTFEVAHQLEAAGFATPDTIGRLILEDGIRLGGKLPVNTHGGLLSEGHMVGLNHIVEATRQLRGECGPRQVPGARHIAVTGWGNLGDGSITILGRHDGPA
ncbi:thiolase C-terminal domain-containing protein [Jiangella asiatica]|uniref:Transporter n=1 Tax=Jiangella asiatica TaxID=2530372 RepID=A0A4R5DEK7_9ACTN|nr:transporter [Jiangella asiatica]TDE10174.1 transporter [Jiangella asiatica]